VGGGWGEGRDGAAEGLLKGQLELSPKRGHDGSVRVALAIVAAYSWSMYIL
jgi:hypothetical protein